MQPNRRTFIQRSSLVTAGLLGTTRTATAAEAVSDEAKSVGVVEGEITHGPQPLEDIEVRFDDEQSTETGGNGSYEQELEPGSYALEVDHRGYATESRAIDVVAGETATADFELEREWGPGEGEFEVYVTEIGGGSTLECEVTVYGDGEEHTVTAPGGTIPDGDRWTRGFVVPEGWWEIRTSGLEGYSDGYDEVYVEEGETVRSWVQVLDEDRTIHHNGWVAGAVTDENGDPISDATVTVAGEKVATTTTGDEGAFGVEREHGEYTLVVEAEGYESAQLTTAVRFGRITEQHVTLEPVSDSQ